MAIRVKLIKSWKHPHKAKAYAVGTVLQVTRSLAGELLADKVGVLYDGKYPPQGKEKIELKQLKIK